MIMNIVNLCPQGGDVHFREQWAVEESGDPGDCKQVRLQNNNTTESILDVAYVVVRYVSVRNWHKMVWFVQLQITANNILKQTSKYMYRCINTDA